MKKLLITIGLLITIIGCEYEEFDPTAPIESDAVKWTDGIVYYRFDANLPEDGKRIVRRAIDKYELISSLYFIEIGNETKIKYFCVIKKGNSNYCSGTGMHKKMFLVLKNYADTTIVLHELGHLIGLYHEHQREDRDKYIKVNWENIRDSYIHNFVIVKHDLIPENKFQYDYDSIMHYENKCFSKNNRQVFTILQETPFSLNLAPYKLSDIDIQKIQYLYPMRYPITK